VISHLFAPDGQWPYASIVLDRIVIDPAVHLGKACVRRTRVPVYCVLELVEQGVSFEQIVEHFNPELAVEDVRACVSYAAELTRAEEVHAAGASG
jgi:uncharacterized protein (DUF433 family)